VADIALTGARVLGVRASTGRVVLATGHLAGRDFAPIGVVTLPTTRLRAVVQVLQRLAGRATP